MPRPVHFEIHVDDPQRAMKFYGELFGWTFKDYGDPGFDYWLVTTGAPPEPGMDGGLMRRLGGSGDKVIAWVVTVDVPDIDSYTAKALDLGAQTAVAKQAIPGMGWSNYLKDPDGNIFGLFQVDDKAA